MNMRNYMFRSDYNTSSVIISHMSSMPVRGGLPWSNAKPVRGSRADGGAAQTAVESRGDRLILVCVALRLPFAIFSQRVYQYATRLLPGARAPRATPRGGASSGFQAEQWPRTPGRTGAGRGAAP
jgi:hypothetical protein